MHSQKKQTPEHINARIQEIQHYQQSLMVGNSNQTI